MDHERIDRTLIAACNRSSLAGLAVGIVKNGSVVYAKGFGVADAARGIAITPDTSFRIGSISKTFTAIALTSCTSRNDFSSMIPSASI
jgi:CubicO group peptidase (beta-lactamase class C family)